MSFMEIAPLWRGIICWGVLAMLLADVFLRIVEQMNRLPRRRRYWLGTLVFFLLTWLLICASSKDARLADGLPTPGLFIFLAAKLAEIGLRSRRVLLWLRGNITPNSIREGMDNLPTALCFYENSGLTLLTNHAMHRLSEALCGTNLRSGVEFWNEVRKRAEECGIFGGTDAFIVRLADGSVWSFRHKALTIGGRTVQRITAADVSGEYALTRELEEKNRESRRLNERLVAYGKIVEEMTREEEILATKVRIHDDLGKVLLASRRCLNAGTEEKQTVLTSWQQTVTLFGSQEEPEKDNAPLHRLIEAARSIGVTIAMRGEFPAAGASASRCLIAAAHECLTNAVRHANAAELRITGAREGNGWRFTYANDGVRPDKPIVEGGGLSSLRRRVEREGGTMTVICETEFMLTLAIPAEQEEGSWLGV